MAAVKADRLIQKTRDTNDELTPLPSLLNETSATGLKEIGTYINVLTSLWEDAKIMSETMDQIKVLRKGMDALMARCNEELKALPTPASSCAPSMASFVLSGASNFPEN